MIDREVITIRLAKIRENVTLLQEVKEVPFEAFISNAMMCNAAEHELQVSIQAVIDICSYLVSELLLPPIPTKPADFAHLLAKHGILPSELAKRLIRMFGMRNVIVHLYLQVDLERVYKVIQNSLGDFDEFARYIVDYLEKEGIA